MCRIYICIIYVICNHAKKFFNKRRRSYDIEKINNLFIIIYLLEESKCNQKFIIFLF